jgi:Tol biopolymer transport system component
VADSGGCSDVWVVSLDGKTRVPAVVGPSDDRPVGWSRDGRYLLFSSDRSGSPALWAVEVQDAGVGDAQVVSSQLGHFDPLGLDDAGNLYYRPRPSLNTTSILRVDPKVTEIASTLPDAGPTLSGVFSPPVWSADGQSAAYVQDLRGVGGRLHLIIRNVATGHVKELNPDIPRFGPMTGHLRWSPDGRTLMYIWDWNADGSRMYAIDVQSGSTKLLASTDQWYSVSTTQAEHSVLRAWTKDNKLYFDRGVGEGAKDIAVVEHDMASGLEREVFRGPAGWVKRLALSPDGDTLYFRRPAGDGKTPPQDLVARDLRTGAERVLVARQHVDDLNLSPDGRFLFFAMREDPASNERMFAVVPTSGGAPRQLPAMDMFYTWLPDSSAIIARSGGFQDQSTRYLLVPLDGSPTRPIAALGSGPIGISVSPTGAHLAFHQWPSTPPPSQIWRMDLRPPRR